MAFKEQNSFKPLVMAGDGAGVVWINPVVLFPSCAAMPSFPNKTEASVVASG